jgi:molybdopterin-guanine dinucleotide biosynthesis protein A
MKPSTVAAFILAGGKSTRMGADKAFLPMNGRTLLAHALETAHTLTNSVFIVGDPAKFAGFGPTIPDIFPDTGPLGGIHAALAADKAEFNLMLGVDMPLMSGSLLSYLVQQAQASSAMVTIPYIAGFLQPLCAVYRKDFAAVAEHALRAANYKIDPLFRTLEIRQIADSELQEKGFSERLFANVNTAEEYRTLFSSHPDVI